MNVETYPSYLQPLMQLLKHVHPISPAIGQYIIDHTDQVEVLSGEMLQESGSPSIYTYFIVKGDIRGFITEDKKDITTWISTEGELVSSISGIDGNADSLENIQALEECVLLRIANKTMHELYDLYPEFNIVGRKMLQSYYRDAEKRAFVVRLKSAEHKYLFFLEHYTHLSNRIQLQYIASFLGITMETLSRVRRKISFS
jgi:CRP-like cAMP-binding protein